MNDRPISAAIRDSLARDGDETSAASAVARRSVSATYRAPSDATRERLARLAIARPCSAPWDAMRGTAAVRHCDRCARDVHDLAQMTTAEVLALLDDAEKPCLRITRRPDGRLVTRDGVCPPSPRDLALARGLAILTSAGIAGGLATSAAAEEWLAHATPVSTTKPARAAQSETRRSVHLLDITRLWTEVEQDLVTMGTPPIVEDDDVTMGSPP